MRRLRLVIGEFCCDPIDAVRRLRELPIFFGNAVKYRRLQQRLGGGFRLRVRQLLPILGDRTGDAGVAKGHYFHQDLLVARHIYRRRPTRHVDIGSRIDGFVAHLLPFMAVEYVDMRPLSSSVPGLEFIRGDMLKLPLNDSSIESLSALHSTEHVGLGRYGDEINPLGWKMAIDELKRVLAPGGILYFSVPISEVERVEFDAHRIFRPQTILASMAPLRLTSYAYVDDVGDLHMDADPSESRCWHGCGIFTFHSDSSGNRKAEYPT